MKYKRSIVMSMLSAFTFVIAPTVSAQDTDAALEEVVVTGIRGSLRSALDAKRNADSLIEVIQAEDIGKLPDQNLAEVLENVTGVQITREAGVGTGIQIRGTDENRVQINGVSTVSSGTERGGISFEDIDASIISAVEVIKTPEAKTTEGSVGGTVNLRTIRPLDLAETLGHIRFQFEDSSLSSDSASPRVSAAYGDVWDTAAGKVGFVVSGSYTESDVSHFRPRVDRDNVVDCSDVPTPSHCQPGQSHFMGVQFLNQVYINQEYTTENIAASLEIAPSDNLKLYTDLIINDQERLQESSRAQFSNVSRTNGSSDQGDPAGSNMIATAFTTYNLGSFTDATGTYNLGSIEAVTVGTMIPFQAASGGSGRGAPFLRASMDSGSRITDTTLFRIGAEIQTGNLSSSVEISKTEAKSYEPNLSLTLNFINPNSYRDADRDENGIPVAFDLRSGISFGIDMDSPYAPTTAMLLDPANYVMDNGGTLSRNERNNKEDAFRADFSYDLGGDFFSSIDFGYRYNDLNSVRDNISGSAGGTSSFTNSLNGAAVANLLAPIPDNFGDGTGSSLYVSHLLTFDPEQAHDPIAVANAINAGIVSSGVGQSPLDTNLVSNEGAYYDISETTDALYLQANFEKDRYRGNFGFRYIETDVNSISTEREFDDAGGDDTAPNYGAAINTPRDVTNSYDFFLLRANLIVDLTDDLILRAAYSEDINRPDFESLTFGRTLPGRGGVNGVSQIGNPYLEPEEVESIDLSLEWYFAPEAVASIGYFKKTRGNLFGDLIDLPGDIGGGLREQQDIYGRGASDRNSSDEGAPCALGGVFSDDTDAGIFGSGRGVCVGDSTITNVDGETEQSGFEIGFQYDLSEFEDTLGWASGFGFIANYTIQDADVNTGYVAIGEGRALAIYELQGYDRVDNPVSRETVTLLNLSEDSYNLTVFYEKYGFSARMRYTWRSAYRTDDLPGTGNEFDPMGFRPVVEDRGQLNLSASYLVTDSLTLSVDAINLTEEDMPLSCVNEGGPLCYQGITDRRILAGASYSF